ncbi:hypothetical protein [Moraxella catarrhalis]|uniref:hypothetical protein n=1 Tax=Moraxella catarrhalis TaxID=480 RepID=UPI00128C6389|nr:hypothetical protein [Moraxella catarrhalis]
MPPIELDTSEQVGKALPLHKSRKTSLTVPAHSEIPMGFGATMHSKNLQPSAAWAEAENAVVRTATASSLEVNFG